MGLKITSKSQSPRLKSNKQTIAKTHTHPEGVDPFSLVFLMKFSIHRTDHEDGYDSLWSDSEEDEFPVSPSSSEAETPDLSEDEYEEDVSFSRQVEGHAERTFRRRSVLADISIDEKAPVTPSRRPRVNKSMSDSSYLKHKPRPSVDWNGLFSPTNNSTDNRIATSRRMENEFEELDKVLDQLSHMTLKRYQDEIKHEDHNVNLQLDELENIEDHERDLLLTKARSLRQQRNSVIREMIDRETRVAQELMLEREQEKERIKQEKIARLKAIEEERARKKAEEDYARRKAQEDADARAKAAKERLEAAKRAEDEKKARAETQAQAEAKAKKEAQIKAEAEAEAEAEAKAKVSKGGKGFTDWRAVEAEFLSYKQKIAEIKSQILAPVSSSKEFKTVCFNGKRRIKPKVGQLTDSVDQLNKILLELDELFTEAKNFAQLPYLWLLNFYAKSVVHQAETETIVHAQSALPLASLSIQLIMNHPQLQELLLARFVKKCPQVIGYSCSIDTEEGRVRMGWKKRDGKWEDEAMYSERMAGICSVWSVITQTKLSAKSGHVHPYPISNSWRFLARQLNKDPKLLQNSDYCVVAAWWDIAAKRFLEAYGKQGHKLLTATWKDWTDLSKDKKFPAAARLRLLGEEWVKTGVPNKGLRPMVA